MSKRSLIVAPLALAAILAVGFGVIWAVLVSWVDQGARDEIGKRQHAASRQVQVAINGTPFVQTYRRWDGPLYHTLEGEEIVAPRRDGPPLLKSASLRAPSRRFSSQTVPWNRRIVQFVPTLQPAMLWYFVHDGRPEGSGCFVAYDRKTNLCAGYFGNKGFRSERPPAEERLPVDGRLMLEFTAFDGMGPSVGIASQASREGADPEIAPRRAYLISGTRLLEIDFREDSVRTVLEADGLASLNFLNRAADASSPLFPPAWPELRSYLAVRTPDSVLVIHPRRAERRSYRLPDEVRDRNFQFYDLSNQTALLIVQQASFGEMKYLLFWVDPAGKVIRSKEVVGSERTAWSEPKTRAWVDAAAIPSPLALSAFYATELAERYLWSGEARDHSAAVAAAFSAAWPALIAVTSLSAGLTILVWRRQRRYGAAGTALWMIFVVLGGLPGLLAYRFHRRWPVLQACPACGETVPRDRDACAHCGAEFPSPAPKGIEVFAP